jgi:predicted esterase
VSGIEAHSIPVQTHGRYLVRRAEAASGARMIVGFHGYKETAEVHLADLAQIPGASAWTVVAVQGLHVFYRGNEVVASWMTRLQRELAIADNVAYVHAVVREVVSLVGTPVRLVFAGFSQGVAMAYRAAAASVGDCHGVIALAGDVPPELRVRDVRLPPVLLGRGTLDSWYTEAKMNLDLEALALAGVPAETVVFEGGHEWREPFLDAAGRFLARL